MTPEIWADLNTRIRNLRADIIGQWQGDIDNIGIDHAIQALGAASQSWQQARPIETVTLPNPPLLPTK